MATVVTDAGELELLDKMLRDALTTDEDYVLNLYQNDYTPVAGSTDADFTVATFTNYAEKTIARSDWGAASTVSGKGESEAPTQTWTCGVTGNTVYGYWVEGATSGTVLWAEKFDTARPLAENDVLNLTPKFNLYSEN